MSELESTDLVCRGRRESLSEEERRQLEHLLRTSFEARLTSAALRGLDRESQVQRGDEALILRMATRGSAQLSRIARRRLFRPWSLAAALCVLLATAAAVAFWAVSRERRESQRSTLALPTTAAASANLLVLKAPVQPIPEQIPKPLEIGAIDYQRSLPTEPSKAEPSKAEPSKAEPSKAEPSKAEPSKAELGTVSQGNKAAQLFARANLLRRQGQNGEAIILYRAVAESYPDAREASPARLALGKLEQDRDPRQALIHYRALAKKGDQLRAEALWGIAESGRRLGDKAVEQRALSDLLHEFPNSPYAEAARRRQQNESP